MICKTLYVFSTARGVREFANGFDSSLVPKATTILEFEQNLLFHPNFREASEDERFLLMLEAVKLTKALTSEFKISSNMYEFMKNSHYLFSFFKELALSKKSVEDIRFGDIYAGYDAHLLILKNLQEAYLNLLAKNGLYDEISLCESYEINSDFVSEFESIIIQVDGILSEFELEIISKIAHFSEIKLRFHASKFNQKTISQISKLMGGAKFCIDNLYEVNLNDKSIIKTTINSPKCALVREFSLRNLQCSYVFEKISNFVNDGIEPERIAVILSDESFAQTLATFDSSNMLNFAMGTPFSNSLFYQSLSLLCEFCKKNLDPNLSDDYIEKAAFFDEKKLFLNSAKIKNSTFKELKVSFEKEANLDIVFAICSQIYESVKLGNEMRIKITQKIFEISKILDNYKLSLREFFDLFLNKLSRIKIDDVTGGKVVVMGVLESRGLKFDGVIIVDFNDTLVPTRSVNEMFLNSDVRARAGLISHFERENLQKFYYHNLIISAKKSAISYVKDDEKNGSGFLRDIFYVDDKIYSDDSYLAMFLKGNASIKELDDEIVLKHDFFDKPLSFSRLNIFLKCPRRYYYKYILMLKEARSSQTNAKYIGLVMHRALEIYYKAKNKFVFKDFFPLFLAEAKSNGLNPLEIEIFKNKFIKFGEVMAKHEAVYTLHKSEVELRNTVFGVEIYGKIDRIDFDGSCHFIIDYKSGKADPNSLQIPFYEALFGAECKSAFFSFKDISFVPCKRTIDELKDQILAIKNINLTQIDFIKTQKPSNCEFCSYKLLCKKNI